MSSQCTLRTATNNLFLCMVSTVTSICTLLCCFCFTVNQLFLDAATLLTFYCHFMPIQASAIHSNTTSNCLLPIVVYSMILHSLGILEFE